MVSSQWWRPNAQHSRLIERRLLGSKASADYSSGTVSHIPLVLLLILVSPSPYPSLSLSFSISFPSPSSLLPSPSPSLSLSLSFSPYPLPLRFPASIEKFVTNLRSYSRAMSQVTLRQLLCCWNCCSGIVGYYQIKVMSTKNKPNPDFSLQFIRVLNEYIVKSINRHT